MKCCINDVKFIRLLLLSTELFKFEIQIYGQILCVHKPYFLMPGHISGSSKNPRLYVANTLLYSSHYNNSDCSIREYRSIVATITGHQA